MKKITVPIYALIAVFTALLVTFAEARNFVSVKSSYLGDGWFSYTVRMEPNPFFSTQIMMFAGAPIFTNKIDSNTAPEGWTESTNTDSFVWDKNDQTEPHILPLEFTMLGRSASSGFRTETNFWVGFLLWINGWLQSPLLSQDIAGYVRLPALFPCEPNESDGSPTELFSAYEIFPDPEVIELGSDHLSYFWPSSNTVLIEASHDFQVWSNVAQVVGYGGTTTWSSAQSMDTFGSYFRVGLVAMKALTNTTTSPVQSSSDPIAVFHRLTPEGLIVSGPNGTHLLPAGDSDSKLWYLPIRLQRDGYNDDRDVN